MEQATKKQTDKTNKPKCKHSWQGFIDRSQQVNGAFRLFSKCRKCGEVLPHEYPDK